MKIITRTVWMLSAVSLLTDVASEMLYPVVPVYLRSIGFSIFLIGILEGIAEATAGLSKGYFGKLSDNTGKRLPFVRLGYALSALSKPMMAFFTSIAWVFSVRTLDRLGKGIRTGARDALLSDEATPQTKARVFGFHRGMDTFGAVLGPAIALLFLSLYPGQYKTLFYIAFIPGVLAIFFTFAIKEKLRATSPTKKATRLLDFLRYLEASPLEYRKLVTGLLLFALFNSSDIFLILKIKESGFSDTSAIGVYIFYNLIYALCAYPLGSLADRIGLRTVFLSGLVLFAAVYAGMAVNTNLYLFYGLFLLYGVYAAATEGITKAWITNVAAKQYTATAIGTYTALQSICTMLASTITGALWFAFGAKVMFLITALMAIIALVYFLVFVRGIRAGKGSH
ncbi:MAG: MFS transporter [Bacteroidota bacterium]